MGRRCVPSLRWQASQRDLTWSVSKCLLAAPKVGERVPNQRDRPYGHGPDCRVPEAFVRRLCSGELKSIWSMSYNRRARSEATIKLAAQICCWPYLPPPVLLLLLLLPLF